MTAGGPPGGGGEPRHSAVSGGVRYVRDVGPDDVGTRVSVRRRLAAGGLGDVVGGLELWSDGVLSVRDRHGVVHEVAEDDVVAAKRVPPAPARR